MRAKNVISKEEAIRRGYKKTKQGTYYKRTVLDKYYEQGYLDLPHSKYSADERKKAGEMLAHDFYMGHYNTLKSPILHMEIIPTTGTKGIDASMVFQDRYLSAVKNIPYEFWPTVRKVCIEDEELVGQIDEPKQSLRNKQSVYYQKMLLNLGLDRLLKFYLKNFKKNS